jgi:hypothetical protein
MTGSAAPAAISKTALGSISLWARAMASAKRLPRDRVRSPKRKLARIIFFLARFARINLVDARIKTVLALLVVLRK